ncbi:MAG: class I SAM-dependent methyltransferase [Clostridia bacterium]|nr:class I SAM-dependent methyltransferase [Clostridia bacterium]
MPISYSALHVAHKFIADNVRPGDICIDATAGRGGDTAFLCELVGERGKVIAFDIQQEAIDSTRALLEKRGLSSIAELHLCSHSLMDEYAAEGTISCITFNFGWLPGGDHNIFTLPDTSIAAIDKGLRLLKPGGVMSLCIYYGRETGYAERDALLEHLATIDSDEYAVIVSQFVNRSGCPPIPVSIIKAK